MATENAKIDGNRHKAMLAEKDDGSGELQNLRVDPTTKRLKVSAVITSSFTSLSDTPSSYTGEAGKSVIVNATEDGLEFGAGITTPVSVADGGTGATDASTARTNLGLSIGSDVQAHNAGLDAIAGLTPSDGDVLYYNSGWQRLAKGSDTEVLTLASGIPSWVASAGGGSSEYDATVGSSGANYTDIQAAITGVGGTDIKLLLITDVTEDSNITIPSGANILINVSSFNLDVGNYQFIYAGNGNTHIKGNGAEMGSKLTYAHTSLYVELFESSSSDMVQINDLTIDNNSTANGADLSAGGLVKIENVIFELPNNENCGVVLTGEYSYLNNVEFVGGGTSCAECCVLNSNAVGNNLFFSGTFIPTGGFDKFLNVSNAICSNIFIDLSTNKSCIIVNSSSILSNIKSIGSYDCDLLLRGLYIKISNANLGSGDIDTENDSEITLQNIITTGSLDLSDGNSDDVFVTNCRISGALTIGGDRHKFSNSYFLGGASVSSGADNNGFVNCQFGPDAGGGSLTLTVDSGSNNTRIVGCMTDAAISDAGTGTVTSANVIY